MKTKFTSIHFPFAIDVALGRLQQETDHAAHVEQMIRQVLLTSPGERVNRPDFGCGLKRMLFAPNSEVAATLAQVTVFESLNKWLSSVIVVNDVKVKAIEERLEVYVSYTLRVGRERRYLNIEVAP